MVKVEMLRQLMNERLTAVVEEICGLFVATVAEYEEKLSRSNVDTEQQPELLTPVLSDGGQMHYPEIKRVFAIKEEQQQESFSLDQNPMEHLYIKMETGEPGNILEEQHLERPECPSSLTDTQQVISTNQAPSTQQERKRTRKLKNPKPPHSDGEQETPCTQREESPPNTECSVEQEREAGGDEENRNSECPGSSSAQHMEMNGENCDRAALQADIAKTSNSSDCETEDSDDDWKTMPAQQSNSKLMKNTEVPASEQVKTLASNGGLKSGNNLQPACELQPDSSEPETEDSEDDNWNCSRTLTSVKPAEVPESSSQPCQTSFSFSIRGKGFQVKQQVEKRRKTHPQEAALPQTKRGKKSSHTANSSKPSKPKKPSHSSASKTKGMEEKSFRCSVCDTIFKKKTYWLLHMKIHKAERGHDTTRVGGNT